MRRQRAVLFGLLSSAALAMTPESHPRSYLTWGIGPKTCNTTANAAAFTAVIQDAFDRALDSSSDAATWQALLVHLASWWALHDYVARAPMEMSRGGDSNGTEPPCGACAAALRLALLAWGQLPPGRMMEAFKTPLFAGSVTQYINALLRSAWPLARLLR